MNHWDYFLFLFNKSFVTGKTWYLTFFFCFLFALMLYKTFKVDKVPYQKIYLLSLIPFLFPLLMLVWGTLFEHTNSITADVPAWQLKTISIILYVQLAISLACIVYFKGIRLLVAALAVLQMYFTLPFFLVAYMSISGSWM